MRAKVTDRYFIKLPGDMFARHDDFLTYAIDVARERARLYCMPCTWSAKWHEGNIGDWEITVLVRRTRLKGKSRAKTATNTR